MGKWRLVPSFFSPRRRSWSHRFLHLRWDAVGEFEDLEIGHVLDSVQSRQPFQDSLEADDSIAKVSLACEGIIRLVQVCLGAGSPPPERVSPGFWAGSVLKHENGIPGDNRRSRFSRSPGRGLADRMISEAEKESIPDSRLQIANRY
jgi:hypothetical protein